ncbi:SDR family oxidoreductase [Hazenella sp. IB182357]|uniref:SDR family oxidoreductase n=2 Tax=Polycladospora coralii TaxID=2771432 RepID=A0A926N4S4_9BACL|nr:SDR family oxidoreductase [Polycladospora coralii]MBD1370879.1 SDR family oxidoreductase [Polycladospora coralii]MBS7529818.1 SDR family oxidoreductase [Polycladospora coralii]
MKKVALITGCSGGLGKLAALILAQNDWQIACNSRHRDQKMDNLLQQIKNTGNKAFPIYGDVSKREDSFRIVQETFKQFGKIDSLIHTVGPFIRERKMFVEHSDENIMEMINGNLLSALWMAKAVLPHMREHKQGRIIFFGFGRVQEAPAWPDRSVYAAAKSGLASFTKTLSVEEAPFGITVNMVCPGDIVGENKEKYIDQINGLPDGETPRGRPGSGEDVARVIRFLVEDSSDFVTGSLINITGGLDVIHPISKRLK